jgi:hypothetical protein
MGEKQEEGLSWEIGWVFRDDESWMRRYENEF